MSNRYHKKKNNMYLHSTIKVNFILRTVIKSTHDGNQSLLQGEEAVL